MEAAYETTYHDAETTNWWFRARRDYLLQLLRDVPRSAKVLDIGCSSGLLLLDLEAIRFKKENLFGIDISEKAIANCRANGLKNVYVMDAQHISLQDKFDVIIASDCLEHLENDNSALKNWASLLTQHGKMYVFVPAFQSLWSDHDIVNMHYRRYTRKELRNKMQHQGLHVIKSGYWNILLLVPLYPYRLLRNLKKRKNAPAKGDIIESRLVNTILYAVARIENRLLRFIRLPFGVSTYCIASK